MAVMPGLQPGSEPPRYRLHSLTPVLAFDFGFAQTNYCRFRSERRIVNLFEGV
jgi:hypothetical protein